jgi:uncharacterized membrane protein YkoI
VSILRSLRLPVTAVVMGLVMAGCAKSSPVTDAGPDAQVVETEGGLLSQATITPDSAMAIAKARVPGRVAKAELEKEDGKLIYSFDIKVVGKDDITEVHVDAGTGAVLKVDPED